MKNTFFYKNNVIILIWLANNWDQKKFFELTTRETVMHSKIFDIQSLNHLE